MRQSPPRALLLAGCGLLAWSLAYAVPHVYWALGGGAGLSAVAPSASALPQWRAINWAASPVLVLAGLIGAGLIWSWGRSRRWGLALLLAALAGCSIAASHGVYGIVSRVLQVAGVTGVDGQAFDAARHPWVLWDLLVFEPWFLIEGVLFAVAGWCYLVSPVDRRRWVAACAVGVAVGLLSGLLGLRVG
jgi:hypothetical protein